VTRTSSCVHQHTTNHLFTRGVQASRDLGKAASAGALLREGCSHLSDFDAAAEPAGSTHRWVPCSRPVERYQWEGGEWAPRGGEISSEQRDLWLGVGGPQAAAALDRSGTQPASMRADDAHYPAVLCPWYRRYAARAGGSVADFRAKFPPRARLRRD